MEQEKPNYYAVIPAEIRYDEELRANEKLMYGEITALTSKTGVCTASNNYFARLYNVKPSAISKWVKDLQNRHYIDVEYERHNKEIKKRLIKITGINKCEYVVTKKGEGYSQKEKENNTSINNTSNKEIYKESWDCEEYVKDLTIAEIGYLNDKTGRNFREDNPKTISLIRARLRDGYRAIDIMRVIDIKCDEWLDTDMEKYLRPETLFGTKFENYLNQRRTNDKRRI